MFERSNLQIYEPNPLENNNYIGIRQQLNTFGVKQIK